MRTAPSSGPASSTAVRTAPATSKVSTSSVVPAAERGQLGAERVPLVVVHQRERVRAGAAGGDAVARGPPRRLEVEAKPGEVGGPGAGHRGHLVRAAGAHLDQRPAVGRRHHPGRRRGDRAVVVEDGQRQRLQHDGLGERRLHHQDR